MFLTSFPQFPETTVLVALFQDVENAQQVKTNLIKGNEQYDFCFINADNIISQKQVLSATYKTLVDDKNKTTKSKSLNTEIILNVSPFRNIMDALNKFGISNNCSNLVVVKLLKAAVDADDEMSHLKSIVSGAPLPFNDQSLEQLVNLKVLRKNYKLGNSAHVEKLPTMLVGVTQLKG